MPVADLRDRDAGAGLENLEAVQGHIRARVPGAEHSDHEHAGDPAITQVRRSSKDSRGVGV